MRGKVEREISKVLNKHQEFITYVKYRESKDGKTILGIDIKLKPGVVIYLINFTKNSNRGTNADIVNKFDVSRADILNGSFAKSFDGFHKYDSNGKLGVVMGLGYVFGNDIEIVTPKFIGNLKTQEMNLSDLLLGVQSDSSVIYQKKEMPACKTDISDKQGPAGIGATKSKKILSVSQFDKFAKSKGFNAKFSDTEKFVAFMFKYSKDLFGRSSLKGMSWTAIYNLNPNSADWIGWSKIDTDDFLEYVKQYSRKRK